MKNVFFGILAVLGSTGAFAQEGFKGWDHSYVVVCSKTIVDSDGNAKNQLDVIGGIKSTYTYTTATDRSEILEKVTKEVAAAEYESCKMVKVTR